MGSQTISTGNNSTPIDWNITYGRLWLLFTVCCIRIAWSARQYLPQQLVKLSVCFLLARAHNTTRQCLVRVGLEFCLTPGENKLMLEQTYPQTAGMVIVAKQVNLNILKKRGTGLNQDNISWAGYKMEKLKSFCSLLSLTKISIRNTL